MSSTWRSTDTAATKLNLVSHLCVYSSLNRSRKRKKNSRTYYLLLLCFLIVDIVAELQSVPGCVVDEFESVPAEQDPAEPAGHDHHDVLHVQNLQLQ